MLYISGVLYENHHFSIKLGFLNWTQIIPISTFVIPNEVRNLILFTFLHATSFYQTGF